MVKARDCRGSIVSRRAYLGRSFLSGYSCLLLPLQQCFVRVTQSRVPPSCDGLVVLSLVRLNVCSSPFAGALVKLKQVTKDGVHHSSRLQFLIVDPLDTTDPPRLITEQAFAKQAR